MPFCSKSRSTFEHNLAFGRFLLSVDTAHALSTAAECLSVWWCNTTRVNLLFKSESALPSNEALVVYRVHCISSTCSAHGSPCIDRPALMASPRGSFRRTFRGAVVEAPAERRETIHTGLPRLVVMFHRRCHEHSFNVASQNAARGRQTTSHCAPVTIANGYRFNASQGERRTALRPTHVASLAALRHGVQTAAPKAPTPPSDRHAGWRHLRRRRR